MEGHFTAPRVELSPRPYLEKSGCGSVSDDDDDDDDDYGAVVSVSSELPGAVRAA